jgi:16S rRNA (adenine1518-N6/adenine1519-N6)-dimethyltransferase
MSPERLGQHFLIEGWRERVIAAVAPKPDAVWLEIGAGHGEMTSLLASRARQVIAIEIHPPLARRLAETTAPLGNVRVVSGDVLELDLAALMSAACDERVHVYGNLPYYITSPILHSHRRANGSGRAHRRAARVPRIWLPLGPRAIPLAA